MSLTLYCIDGSPPNRAVYLCLAALGLRVTKKVVNLHKLEHLSPWYIKLNPQHTVPTLNDDGVIVCDSHAINAYLVGKYGKDDSLYPENLATRAVVDQRLHFDSGVLFPRLRDISEIVVWLQEKTVPQKMMDRVYEAFDILEAYLEGKNYVAGDNITIADFSCVATVSTLVEAMRFTTENHPLIRAWLQRCRENMHGYAEAQDRGMRLFKKLIDGVLESKL